MQKGKDRKNEQACKFLDIHGRWEHERGGGESLQSKTDSFLVKHSDFPDCNF